MKLDPHRPLYGPPASKADASRFEYAMSISREECANLVNSQARKLHDFEMALEAIIDTGTCACREIAKRAIEAYPPRPGRKPHTP